MSEVVNYAKAVNEWMKAGGSLQVARQLKIGAGA
jgi:hypothetical protein